MTARDHAISALALARSCAPPDPGLTDLTQLPDIVGVYQSIQACRAVAALLVLFFHLGGTVALDRYFGAKSFDTPSSFGDAGVSFFFVLSGFVITLAHRRDFGRPGALFGYIRKRAIRIYPTYLIIAAAVYLAAFPFPAFNAAMPRDVLGLLSEALLLPQDAATKGGTGSTILLVAWSLQYEIFFYAVTALLIVRPALWVIVVTALGVVYTAVKLGAPAPFLIKFVTSESVPLFAYGMALAYLAKSKVKIERPAAIAFTGFAAFAGLACFEVLFDKMPHRETLYGLASCVLILGLVRAEDAAKRPWRFPDVALLGDSSYALYLIHFPLISVVAKVGRAAGLTGTSGAAIVYVAGAVGSIVAAVLFHLYIERPVLKKLSRRRLKTQDKITENEDPPTVSVLR